jgi:hypothetical protein
VLCQINAGVVDAYFTGQNHPSFFSFYNVLTEEKACITSRSYNLLLKLNGQLVLYDAYYVDFFCGNKNNKNKVFYELFCSHLYNQSAKNKKIKISFLKKECVLCKGVVPFVKYHTYTFLLKNTRVDRLSKDFVMCRVFKENKELLTNFVDKMKTDINTHFDFFAIPDIGAIMSMIQSNVLYVFCLKNKNEIYGYYFFKNASSVYEIQSNNAGENTLIFIASYCNTVNVGLFYSGFVHSLKNILKENANYKVLLFDDISDNHLIFDIWKNGQQECLCKSLNAYYLYNFIYPQSPISKTKCFYLI